MTEPGRASSLDDSDLLPFLPMLYVAWADDLSRDEMTLDLVTDLYALWRIELDRGWFLEQGYLEPPKAKAIRKLVNRLCRELRGQAVPLVEAFGIPPELLGAPIARGP